MLTLPSQEVFDIRDVMGKGCVGKWRWGFQRWRIVTRFGVKLLTARLAEPTSRSIVLTTLATGLFQDGPAGIAVRRIRFIGTVTLPAFHGVDPGP